MPGEFDLIRKYFSGHDDGSRIELGIGDDCALLKLRRDESLAITTDTLNEGIHFFKDTDPYLLGYRSLLVNLSDLAAMGADPKAFTLSLSLPEATDSFLKPFAKGLFELADEEGCSLIGGNTSKGSLSITISAYGVSCTDTLRRSGAKSGDGIYVTGFLGLCALYVEACYGRLKIDKSLLSSLCYKSMHQQCRCAFAKELCDLGYSHCAIDISDGIVGDLGHILECSNVGADLWLDKLPLAKELHTLVNDEQKRLELAAFGGCDYELLFTLPAETEDDVMDLCEEHDVPVTKVGIITSSQELRLFNHGKIVRPAAKPFEHF